MLYDELLIEAKKGKPVYLAYSNERRKWLILDPLLILNIGTKKEWNIFKEEILHDFYTEKDIEGIREAYIESKQNYDCYKDLERYIP